MTGSGGEWNEKKSKVLCNFLLISVTSMEASAMVQTAVYTYKGQPYAQIHGGDAAVTEQWNQILPCDQCS